MPPAKPLPAGNDPRQRLDPDDLEAASLAAMPQVARRSGMGDNLGLAAGMVGIAALGLITFFSLGQTPKSKPAPQPAPVQQPVQSPSVLGPVNPEANPEAPPPQSLLVQPSVAANPAPGPAPVQTPPADTRSPAMIIDNSLAPSVNAQASGAAPAAGGSVTLSANDQFVARVTGDVTQKAAQIGDPSKVVPQGAVIPAVLETAINSDLPGYTRAIVSRDIRSFDGTTVLIPRGSRLVGEYKSGLASGETRAFIIWERLIRPDGLSIELASPATDDLGQAGMSGRVDSHFVKRFGSAILLSVVNGLASSLGNGSNTIVIGSSGGAGNLIGDALSNDSKIPPTIKVPQGAAVEVFAARDLDFGLGT